MLDVKNLSVAFRMGNDTNGNRVGFRALRGSAHSESHGAADFVPVTQELDLHLEEGATLGLVGESGSGKSVTSLALMGLLPRRSSRVRAERMDFAGKNLLSLDAAGWRALRGKEIAMVFQDPMTSLNPLMRCGEQIAEAIRFHQGK